MIHHGDALTILRTLPGESIHMCVTSPPYWGLRDYKTGSWAGGLPDCDHIQLHGLQNGTGQRADRSHTGSIPYKDECGKCGARRVDQQLGLEAVHDCLGWATKQPCGECYICHMTEVFREVRRVLRADGTLWINEGDSYSGGKSKAGYTETGNALGWSNEQARDLPPGLKPKDLCGMPWRLALSLQADGWYWRDAIVWDKPAPMPESVRDRCTKSWEPILMFAKAQKYYFDQEAIRELSTTSDPRRPYTSEGAKALDGRAEWKSGQRRNGDDFSGRNKRNVWRLPPMPVSAAHFATYPLELPETCILAGCPIDGTVLDPFAGSGTTGLAALKHGRNFLGIELSAEYITIAEQRLASKLSLFA